MRAREKLEGAVATADDVVAKLNDRTSLASEHSRRRPLGGGWLGVFFLGLRRRQETFDVQRRSAILHFQPNFRARQLRGSAFGKERRHASGGRSRSLRRRSFFAERSVSARRQGFQLGLQTRHHKARSPQPRRSCALQRRGRAALRRGGGKRRHGIRKLLRKPSAHRRQRRTYLRCRRVRRPRRGGRRGGHRRRDGRRTSSSQKRRGGLRRRVSSTWEGPGDGRRAGRGGRLHRSERPLKPQKSALSLPPCVRTALLWRGGRPPRQLTRRNAGLQAWKKHRRLLESRGAPLRGYSTHIIRPRNRSSPNSHTRKEAKGGSLASRPSRLLEHLTRSTDLAPSRRMRYLL